MDAIRIKLCVIWILVMLVYLLGDVIRIYSGTFTPGEMMGKKVQPGFWMAGAVVMVLPIIMALLSMIVVDPVNRWLNIVMAAVFFVFNIIGLPSYKLMAYKFLNVVGLAFNLVTIWQAWVWM